jgi:hypothetical protein
MKKLIPFLGLLILFTFSCEYDGVPRPEEEERENDDTTYTVTEPSDGSIASGASAEFPDFMFYSEPDHRLISKRESQIGLYEFSNIPRIDITFSSDNWAETLATYESGDNELAATISYKGVALPYKVGIRYKGSSDSTDNVLKKSFNISIDYENSKQELDGYNTVVLNGAYSDNTFLHEVVYRHCINKYIPALQVSYVNLHINGVDYGLYVNSQYPNSTFIKEWFLSSKGTRWRAEPKVTGENTTAGLYGTGYSGLNYLGDASSAYEPYYDIKKSHKDDPYADIIAVSRALEYTEADSMESKINKILDLDRTLWFLACENIFTDKDSYIKKGGTDYYLYWEVETGRLVPLEYDGNDTFSPSDINWDPFYHMDDSRFPLLNKLLTVPSIRQRYLAHYRTVIEEVYNPDYLSDMIETYATKIDSAIKADPKKQMTYDEFRTAVAGMKSVVTERYQYLSLHDSVAVKGLTISDVSWQANSTDWATPSSTDTVTVKASITGGGVSSAYLCAATGMVGQFKRLQMYDDGTHGDSKAGDKIFTARINPQKSGIRVRFYIEAVRGNASKTRTYAPAGAEHDVYSYLIK